MNDEYESWNMKPWLEYLSIDILVIQLNGIAKYSRMNSSCEYTNEIPWCILNCSTWEIKLIIKIDFFLIGQLSYI